MVNTENIIEPKVHVKFEDNTYCLLLKLGTRAVDLEVRRTHPIELYLSDLTLEDIKKLGRDLLKIAEDEAK